MTTTAPNPMVRQVMRNSAGSQPVCQYGWVLVWDTMKRPHSEDWCMVGSRLADAAAPPRRLSSSTWSPACTATAMRSVDVSKASTVSGVGVGAGIDRV